MHNTVALEPVDYLVIGHVAHDLTPQGPRLGGTVAYSALTARALGLRVGIVTASGPETSLAALKDIPIVTIESPQSTTFENIYTEHGRVQYIRAQAVRLDLHRVPEVWQRTPIIHLGPIANEMDAVLPPSFSPALLGITPQGWMRQWDTENRVHSRVWMEESALSKADAVVISREDVNGDEEQIEQMAHHTRVLAVTENAAGCVLYWNGDRRRFRAPRVPEIDPTGAGDIYAAAFFVRLLKTRDPWEAARFATLLASHSVTRPGLEGIPTAHEIEESTMEVLH